MEKWLNKYEALLSKSEEVTPSNKYTHTFINIQKNDATECILIKPKVNKRITGTVVHK